MERSTEPLIGRAGELRALVDAIGADRSTFVTGEAGIGKTSLLRAAAAAAGRRVHEGGGFATLDWLPYLALRRALGVGLAGDAAAVAARIERLVGPDVLFVDDLQWVDPESLAAIELVLGRILVVGAIRTGDADAERPLRLADRGGASILSVGPLEDDAAAEVVRRAHPGHSPRATTAIVRRAGGNPLLLEELAVGGAASSVLERALSSRVGRLAPAARDAVALLAVADQPLPRAAAGSALQAAIEDGVVVERDGFVELRHALVADSVRADLEPARVRALHARLAELAVEPVERARHLAAAGETEVAGRVALAGLAQVTDPRDRAALMVIAADAAPPDQTLSMRLRAGRALDEVSEWVALQRLFEQAGDDGTPEELVERDVLLAHAAYALGDPQASRRLLDAAIARQVDPASEAATRLAIELATHLVNVDGRPAEALTTLAVAVAARPEDTMAARDCEVLAACIRLLVSGSGDVAAVSGGLEEAFAAGRYRTATDRARVLQYLLLMGSGAAETLEFLLAQRARFEVVGVGAAALQFLADAVVAAMLAGRLEHAIALADEMAELPGPRRPQETARIHGARSLVFLGRFEQAAEALTTLAAEAAPDYFGLGEVLAGQAELAFWSGRPRVAVELAERALAVPAPIPVAHVGPSLTRAWARLEIGEDPSPTPASPSGAPSPSVEGAVPELDGLRAWHTGDLARAAESFEAAAARWARFNAQRALLCRWASAESRRRAGDASAAAGALTDVLRESVEVGFEALAVRVRRSLRLAGVRGGTSIRPKATVAGGLTARERELVALVERGLTNLEIARRLGLGRPTVARILASAMTKLGVSSRAQLAASAPR